MHDLELARLIHLDREREMARDRRARAAREANSVGAEETFVPNERPTRITHPLRPATSGNDR